MTVQPALHRQHCSVAAPTQLWLDADGRLASGPARSRWLRLSGPWFTGLLHGDTRMLCRAEVRVNGLEPEPATVEAEPGGVLRVRGLVRGIAGPTEDPAVELLQTWTVTPGVVRHSLQLSTSLEALDVEIQVQLAADFTDMVRDPPQPLPRSVPAVLGRRLRPPLARRRQILTVAAPGSVTWRRTAPLARNRGPGRPFEAEWQAVLADSEDAVVAARPPASRRPRDRAGRGTGPAPGQLPR